MSEKPSNFKTPNAFPPRFTPGINVVKKGPEGSVYKFIEPCRGMIKLREFCGTIIELDQKYFLENFDPQEELPQVVQIKGIEYRVTILGDGRAQLNDLENPSNRITITVDDLKKLPQIDTCVPTPPPSQLQKKNLQETAEGINKLIPYPVHLFSINKNPDDLDLPN